MNTQNLEFLKKTLLNLGFGDKLNSDLEKQMAAKTPEFNLATQHEFGQQKVDYTLHFKGGDNQDMYFFNKYDAAIQGKEQDSQTFYINKGNGITAKEAFNLMEGRAVHKQLYNQEGQRYQAWLQLDKENLTEGGNKKIKQFNENYGYDLEGVLKNTNIKEMATPQAQENLLKSLKKGNIQQVTAQQEGKEQKYFIAANPQFKTINVFDQHLKKIKREELLNPPQKQANDQKKSKQQKDELPEKKQSKNRMKVG